MVEGALILVGLLMLKASEGIRWSDTTEAAPAFFTFLLFILRYDLLPA